MSLVRHENIDVFIILGMNLRHFNMQYELCLNAMIKKGTLAASRCTGAKRVLFFDSVTEFEKVYVTQFVEALERSLISAFCLC